MDSRMSNSLGLFSQIMAADSGRHRTYVFQQHMYRYINIIYYGYNNKIWNLLKNNKMFEKLANDHLGHQNEQHWHGTK